MQIRPKLSQQLPQQKQSSMNDELEQREEFKTAHFEGKNLDDIQLSESDESESVTGENQEPFKDK